IQEWRQRINTDGWLVLSVPARQDKWGALDSAAGHFRRYEREDFERLVAGAGFDRIEILSYGFPLMNAVQPIWNAMSVRRGIGSTIDARTRSSARFLQP